MKRPKAMPCWLVAFIVILVAAAVLVGAAIVAFVYFRQDPGGYTAENPSGCKVAHVRFDPLQPESAALASPDQQAILAVDGPPQAFTLYVDPGSGSVIEEWDYFTTGRELVFLDGVFQGGVEVPPPVVLPGASIPEPAVNPWEIKAEFTPACVVELAGTALFATSALVLPGWNDGNEIARQWTLAGGGSMITVDGHLAMLSIDPGEATDLDQFLITDFMVGTLGEGDNRLGAILSPGEKPGSYRLSLSPRGQGTTRDGAELVLDLEGTQLEDEYTLGTDGRASLIELDGSEIAVQSSGKVTIARQENTYEVHFDGIVNDRNYLVAGTLGNGVWKSGDQSPVRAIGEAWPLAERQATTLQLPTLTSPPVAPAPTLTPASVATPPLTGDTSSEPEAIPGWQLLLHDTFDSNINNWPVTYSSDDESVYFQSDLFEDQYLIFAERKEGTRPFVRRWIDYNVGPHFHISVETKQEGKADTDCGLIVATQDEENVLWFFVSAVDGKFRALTNDASGNWYPIIDWTASPAIRAGQANRLALIGDSSGLAFYINGQQVGLVEGAGLEVQRLGLAASVGSDDPVMCYFDNLKIRVE